MHPRDGPNLLGSPNNPRGPIRLRCCVTMLYGSIGLTSTEELVKSTTVQPGCDHRPGYDQTTPEQVSRNQRGCPRNRSFRAETALAREQAVGSLVGRAQGRLHRVCPLGRCRETGNAQNPGGPVSIALCKWAGQGEI